MTDPSGPTELDVPTRTAGTSTGAIDLPPTGYDLGAIIGRGGMGEVVAAHDRRIGRDVAIKRMRDGTSDDAVRRFLREARIQARLDHPAIVPVYELGVDANEQLYFTMKRLAGTTLAVQLHDGAPLPRLLRAFVDVCLAMQFAHERRIVHRDLKPANIILGAYGDVYVLDWGIARVLADASAPATPANLDTLDTLDDSTQIGDVLGTPGYMAPEQIRDPAVGPAADVYALGAILFEILAGVPLHPHGTAGLATTLAEPFASPAERARDRHIAPELDSACVAALAPAPELRPSARELGERVQRYLDGDRDTERRRELAAAELAEARAALASGDVERRVDAVRAAGRALALDASSREAAELMSALIVEPPKRLPAQLETALATEARRLSTDRLKASLLSLVSVVALMALLPLTTISNWTTLGLTMVAAFAAIGLVAIGYARSRMSGWGSMFAGLLLVFGFSRVLGSFVLTPTVIAAAAMVVSANPELHGRPWRMIAWLCIAVFGPLALEATGWFSSTWWMIDGGVCSRSAMMVGTSSSDAFVLETANFALLLAALVYALSVHRRTAAASRALFIQHWHLNQLLPSR